VAGGAAAGHRVRQQGGGSARAHRHFELCLAGGPADAPDELHRAAHRCAAELEALRALLVDRLGADGTAAAQRRARRSRSCAKRAAAARLAADWTGIELQVSARCAPTRRRRWCYCANRSWCPTTRRCSGCSRSTARARARGAGRRRARRTRRRLARVGDRALVRGGDRGRTLHRLAGARLAAAAAAFWDGDWRTGARALLEKDRLPPLADVVGRDAGDLDFAQQVTAFAFVDWLLAAARPRRSPRCPAASAAVSRLGELVASYAVAASPGARAALPAWLADARPSTRSCREFMRARYPKP